MKQLKNYFRSIKQIEHQEKRIAKELKTDARYKAFINSFFIFFPLYLIVINLFIFINYFYLLILTINILILLTIFLYQLVYYTNLELNKYRLTIVKTIIYGLIMSIIVWLLAYFIGGFL